MKKQFLVASPAFRQYDAVMELSLPSGKVMSSTVILTSHDYDEISRLVEKLKELQKGGAL